MLNLRRIISLVLAASCFSSCAYVTWVTHVNNSAKYLAEGDYQAALREATSAIEMRPDNHLAYINRGVVYQAGRQYDNALQDYERAIALAPDEALTHLNYVTLLVFLRRNDNAVRHGEAFASTHPDSRLGKLSLAYALEGKKDFTRAHQLTYEALQAMETSTATDEMKYVKKEYAFAFAYCLLARCAAGLNNSQEANRAMTQAKQYLNDFSVTFSDAKVLYAQRAWQRAMDEIETAYAQATPDVRNSTDGVESRFLVGNCALKLGKLDRARQAYEEFLAANPHEEEAFFNLGQVYAKSGDATKAIDNYSSALRLNPDLLDAYANRGTLYLQAGRHGDAVHDFSTVLKKQPRDTAVLYKRAYALCASGSASSGQNDLRAILKAEPRNAEAAQLFGECGQP